MKTVIAQVGVLQRSEVPHGRMNSSYNNSTSQNESYAFMDGGWGHHQGHTFVNGMTFTVILITFPVTVMAIYALYSLIRKDHIAPIYVINLLLADIIQLCCMLAELWWHGSTQIIYYIYYYCLMASIGFMVCVTLERYLAIAHPLWYHFTRTIRTPVVTCAMVWALPVPFLLTVYYVNHFKCTLIVFSVFFLLPLPLLLLGVVGTIEALSKTSVVPAEEKRRIIAILVTVLLIYLLLFLPTIVWSLVENGRMENIILSNLSLTFIQFSPLADAFLYVFLKKGAVDRHLAYLCYCKIESGVINT